LGQCIYMRCHGEVERLDGALASFATAEAGLRLRLGQVLEVLGRGKHFELGFSSIAAYALERCDRSVRWVEAARCFARRLEALPELRRAVAFGRVSWSMGELLARVALPRDEARWIEAAESRTVRQMRGLVEAAVSERAVGRAVVKGRDGGSAVLVEQALGERALDNQAAARTASAAENGEAGDDDDEVCTLTCTVDREDAWLFEATRTLLEQLGVHGADAQVEALVAEGQGTLLAALPAGSLDLDRCGEVDTAQHRWLEELGRWRAAAEALCEKNFRGSALGIDRSIDPSGDLNGVPKAADPRGAVAEAAALGLSALESAGCRDLDGMLRGLSRLSARHELELSRLVLRFHRADGWRRLGYASEAQYARERLGLSRSSLLARRALALRLEKLPHVAEALGAGQIGVEAAVQVVRVATPSTQAAWVERARQRTIKHLREEVAAALVAVRLSGEAECPPPVDGELAAFHELEQAVVSGRVFHPPPANDGGVADGGATHATGPFEAEHGDAPVGVEERGVGAPGLAEPASEQRRVWLVMLGSLARWLESGVRASAGPGRVKGSRSVASAGRIVLRLRVSRATLRGVGSKHRRGAGSRAA
jgi:hypothetical protein